MQVYPLIPCGPDVSNSGPEVPKSPESGAVEGDSPGPKAQATLPSWLAYDRMVCQSCLLQTLQIPRSYLYSAGIACSVPHIASAEAYIHCKGMEGLFTS